MYTHLNLWAITYPPFVPILLSLRLSYNSAMDPNQNSENSNLEVPKTSLSRSNATRGKQSRHDSRSRAGFSTSFQSAPNTHPSVSPFDELRTSVTTMESGTSRSPSLALAYTASTLPFSLDASLGSLPSISSTEARGNRQMSDPVKSLGDLVFWLLREMLRSDLTRRFVQPVCKTNGCEMRH